VQERRADHETGVVEVTVYALDHCDSPEVFPSDGSIGAAELLDDLLRRHRS
jgi:hypothetical protein